MRGEGFEALGIEPSNRVQEPLVQGRGSDENASVRLQTATVPEIERCAVEVGDDAPRGLRDETPGGVGAKTCARPARALLSTK